MYLIRRVLTPGLFFWPPIWACTKRRPEKSIFAGEQTIRQSSRTLFTNPLGCVVIGVLDTIAPLSIYLLCVIFICSYILCVK